MTIWDFNNSEQIETILTSVMNGQFTQARKQFHELDMNDKEQFIQFCFETESEQGLRLCKSLLINYLD